MDSHIQEWEVLQRAAEQDEAAIQQLKRQQSSIRAKIASTRWGYLHECHEFRA